MHHMSVMLLKSFPGTSAKSLKNCCTSPLYTAVSECDLESPRRLPFISKSRDTCQSFKPAFPKFKKRQFDNCQRLGCQTLVVEFFFFFGDYTQVYTLCRDDNFYEIPMKQPVQRMESRRVSSVAHMSSWFLT